MKRGSFLRRHVRLARVSAKVRRERPAWDAVYRTVDQRSGGRCEVILPWARSMFSDGEPRAIHLARCPARAVEHHHTRRPRRAFHAPAWIMHVCRAHHNRTTASYPGGRLLITPAGDGTFTCAVVQKAGKWAP